MMRRNLRTTDQCESATRITFERGVLSLALCLSRRVNHLSNLRNLGSRKAAQFGVAMDDRLIFGQVHTERLVGGNERFQPLNIRSQLAQGLVGLRRRGPELFPLQSSDLGDVALDYVLLHHFSSDC